MVESFHAQLFPRTRWLNRALLEKLVGQTSVLSLIYSPLKWAIGRRIASWQHTEKREGKRKTSHFSLLWEQPLASAGTYALTRLVVDLEGSSTISMNKDAPRTFYEHRMEWWAQSLDQLLYFSATLEADSPGLLLTYSMFKTPQKLS